MIHKELVKQEEVKTNIEVILDLNSLFVEQ